MSVNLSCRIGDRFEMCFGLEIAANCANASLGVLGGASSSMI